MRRRSATLPPRRWDYYRKRNLYHLLCRAVCRNDSKRVTDLLGRGIGPDQPVFHYTPALVHAAAEGHEDMVKLLLDRGAYANFSTDFGYTALMAACNHGSANMVQMLLERLLEQKAMEAGFGIHIQTTQGETALAFAHQRGDETIIRLLKEAGARE